MFPKSAKSRLRPGYHFAHLIAVGFAQIRQHVKRCLTVQHHILIIKVKAQAWTASCCPLVRFTLSDAIKRYAQAQC
jgi:hypothetical protein